LILVLDRKWLQTHQAAEACQQGLQNPALQPQPVLHGQTRANRNQGDTAMMAQKGAACHEQTPRNQQDGAQLQNERDQPYFLAIQRMADAHAVRFHLDTQAEAFQVRDPPQD